MTCRMCGQGPFENGTRPAIIATAPSPNVQNTSIQPVLPVVSCTRHATAITADSAAAIAATRITR